MAMSPELPPGYDATPGAEPLRMNVGQRPEFRQLTFDLNAPPERARWWWRLVRDHPLLCFGLLFIVMLMMMAIAIVHKAGLDRAILGGTRWAW